MSIEKIYFNGKKIEFSVKGEGSAVVFLHGYIESLSVWDKFSESISTNYKVIAIDLPGHGNSESIDEVHSMELMADVVNEVIDYLKIDKFILVGHSMGGYVTLEYMSRYPQKVSAYCLFHSSPFADTDEKKAERDKIIELIKEGKKVQLAKNHVEKTFSTKNSEKFSEQIGFLKIIAVNTSDDGTIAALKGMKQRKDHFSTMQKSKTKGLWILGKEDNFINFEKIFSIEKPENCEILMLENSGHQGYIEEYDISIKKITEFIEKNK